MALCTTAGVGTVATAAYANALPAPHASGEHADAPIVAPASSPPSSHRPEVTPTPTHHSEPPKPTEAPSSHPAREPTSTETKTSTDVGPLTLCLAYHAAVEHHTVLAAAMQARLATFAGGTANIAAFCTKLLTPSPTATHSETHASATPTTAPSPVTTSLAIGLCNAWRNGTLPTEYVGTLNELAGGADHRHRPSRHRHPLR